MFCKYTPSDFYTWQYPYLIFSLKRVWKDWGIAFFYSTSVKILPATHAKALPDLQNLEEIFVADTSKSLNRITNCVFSLFRDKLRTVFNSDIYQNTYKKLDRDEDTLKKSFKNIAIFLQYWKTVEYTWFTIWSRSEIYGHGRAADDIGNI